MFCDFLFRADYVPEARGRKQHGHDGEQTSCVAVRWQVHVLVLVPTRLRLEPAVYPGLIFLHRESKANLVQKTAEMYRQS